MYHPVYLPILDMDISVTRTTMITIMYCPVYLPILYMDTLVTGTRVLTHTTTSVVGYSNGYNVTKNYAV
jgi:hypothetical protein